MNSFLGLDSLLICGDAGVLYWLKDLDLILQIGSAILRYQCWTLICLYCKFLPLSVASHSHDWISAPTKHRAKLIVTQTVRKIELSNAFFGAKSMRVVEWVDTALSRKERIRHDNAGESFSFSFLSFISLLSTAFIAELDLLKGEQVKMGLFKQL